MGERGSQLTVPLLHGPRVAIRPLAGTEIRAVAQRVARDTRAARWWSSSADTVERWLSDPAYTLCAITLGDESIGVIGIEEELDPDYTFASFDIVIYEPFTGRGYGPEALRTLARWLVDSRGHHRFQIDPSAENAAAINAYEKAGFKPVGIMRNYERGPNGVWRDALLMDLLAGEIPPEV